LKILRKKENDKKEKEAIKEERKRIRQLKQKIKATSGIAHLSNRNCSY
jgi:hypothetical protein